MKEMLVLCAAAVAAGLDPVAAGAVPVDTRPTGSGAVHAPARSVLRTVNADPVPTGAVVLPVDAGRVATGSRRVDDALDGGDTAGR